MFTTILNKVLGFFGLTEHQLLVIVGIAVLAFFLGMVFATGWAADEVMKSAATQVEQAHTEAAVQAKAVADANNKIQQVQQVADTKSNESLTLSKQLAEVRSKNAVTYIEKGSKDATSNSSDLLVGDAQLRRVLDNAAGACSLDTETHDTGAVDAETTTCTATAGVTVSDLEHGYIQLGKSFQEVRGQLKALEQNLEIQGFAATDVK